MSQFRTPGHYGSQNIPASLDLLEELSNPDLEVVRSNTQRLPWLARLFRRKPRGVIAFKGSSKKYIDVTCEYHGKVYRGLLHEVENER